MKIKNRIKSKRGIALENAVMFMVMVSTLCFLLTSLAIIGNTQTKIDQKELTTRVAVDQIGEDFLAGALEDEYEGYTWEKNDAGNALTVRRNAKILLYVEKSDEGLLVWRYSAPRTDTQE